MNRNQVFTENELNDNPLLRKMCERFTCSGNMTIGEIMLHRAERDTRNTSTPTTYMAPTAKAEVRPASVAVIEQPIKTIEAPMRSSRRAFILSFTAITLCAIVLLAFIIPIFANFDADAAGNNISKVDVINTSAGETPAPTPEEEPVSSNFENVMNSFDRTFGK